MNKEEIEKEIKDLLLMKLQECKLKPYDGTIYGDAAEYIASALVDSVVGDLLREMEGDIEQKERFAEQEGVTPDCSPYYIALQYKHQKEVAEKALKEACSIAWSIECTCPSTFEEDYECTKCYWGESGNRYEEDYSIKCLSKKLLKQAEKELKAEKNDE